MTTLPTESESFYNGITEEHTHTFVWPGRVFTMNQGLRGSHWAATKFIAEWREAFKLMSQGCEPLAYCDVRVRTVHGSNRRMDVCAEAIAVKAAVDGIVDGGVLLDDSPEYVRSVLFLAPSFVAGVEMLVVELKGPGRAVADRHEQEAS